MKGTERITLIEPPSECPNDKFGQLVPFDDLGTVPAPDYELPRDRNKLREWVAYVVREDRAGREALLDGALAGKWNARFKIARTPALEGINEKWALVDCHDRAYDIEAVEEAARTQRRYWWVYATRRA